MDDTPRNPKKNATHRIILIVAIIVGLGAALVAISYGIWQLQQREAVTNNPNPIITSEVITHSTDKPDETVPTEACAKYSVAGVQPERLSLPTLGVEGCIERVGLDQHGAIAVPTNIHVAGWYVDSAVPGDAGLSIIDGHINGNYTNDGIFQHLDQLKEKDEFTLIRGNDTVLRYRIVSVKSVPLDEASDVLFNHDTSIASQLNLITCGGQWSEELGQFDRRIIAVAELLN